MAKWDCPKCGCKRCSEYRIGIVFLKAGDEHTYWMVCPECGNKWQVITKG